MNEYVCFYNGKRWECYASSMFDAKEKAVAYFKPPADQNREFNIGIRLLTSCIHQHFIKAMQ